MRKNGPDSCSVDEPKGSGAHFSMQLETIEPEKAPGTRELYKARSLSSAGVCALRITQCHLFFADGASSPATY